MARVPARNPAPVPSISKNLDSARLASASRYIRVAWCAIFPTSGRRPARPAHETWRSPNARRTACHRHRTRRWTTWYPPGRTAMLTIVVNAGELNGAGANLAESRLVEDLD